MIPLLHETHFTFRFGDDRIIPRFHLEGIEAGQRVSVFKIDADSGERQTLMTMATVGEGGWVELPEPILVRGGNAGYHAVWHGQKAWNGVAILARSEELVETGRGLPGDPDDVQSRYLEAAVGGVRVGCLYLPNGNPAPGPKFDYKLRWLERLTARAAELVARPEPVILAGDFNVIPEAIDVYNPAGWEADALFRPESREAYRRLLAKGWADALRHLNPSAEVYTFWDYTGFAWKRNAGLRIDHLLLNPAAATRLVSAGVDRDVRGWEKTSDHAPTWVDLRGD